MFWRRDVRVEPILDAFALLAKSHRIAEIVESTDPSSLDRTERELLETRRELSDLAATHAEAELQRWSDHL